MESNRDPQFKVLTMIVDCYFSIVGSNSSVRTVDASTGRWPAGPLETLTYHISGFPIGFP